MPATLPFREALNKGIVSGTLVDTKIILFSRRDTSGRVYGPKALYASSHVLRSVPYFNDLLFGNFSEAELRDLNDGGCDHESTAEDYDYYSDSDLEDDEGEDPTLPTLPRGGSGAGPSKAPHKPVINGYGSESNTELSNKGKIIRIPDIAFITFQAFIFYLYTGQIEFSTPGSRGNQAPSNDGIPLSSPKSIYRLADKYNTPALKDLALSHIRTGLKNRDIVGETFSAFTLRHDDIKTVCVPQLVLALRNDTAEKATWMRFCEVLDDHDFKGDPGHVADVLALLWEAVTEDDDCLTDATRTEKPDPPPPSSSTSWDPFQTAMMKSIREGDFFDRKYRTRYTKTGSIMKAVYCSSVVLGSEREACIAQSNNEITVVGEPADGIDTESDCHLTETEDVVEGENGGTGVVLLHGSYSAWRSIFFYMCTGEILFAPLRSQGAESRAMHIIEKTTAESPPPCSPKSIYILANLLNIQPLCDLALKDIESKISEDNIVEEFFSPVTANEQRVAEMECRLLLSKFKSKGTMSRAREKISSTPRNHLAHRASIIKFGMRAALDQKKQKPQAAKTNGVMLQCYSSACPGHTEHMFYSLAATGPGLACPWCKVYVMKCVGCGQERRREPLTECESCKKKFL